MNVGLYIVVEPDLVRRQHLGEFLGHVRVVHRGGEVLADHLGSELGGPVDRARSRVLVEGLAGPIVEILPSLELSGRVDSDHYHSHFAHPSL